MRVGITGGTGFIGHYIVNRLASAGHDCRCWHRSGSDTGGLENVADRVEWIPGELTDPTSAEPLVDGVDAIVHSALFRPGAGFRGAEGDLLTFVETNLMGSLRLMEAARKANVKRFVFIATCAVHEEILDDRPLDETHPLWPRTHYGAHKAALEKFVHSYGLGQGWNICSLRPSGVYGVTRPAKHSKWFDLVQSVVRGETVDCQKGGKEVHAADVAKAVEILLGAEGTTGQAYSCCDRYISQFEVATLAKEISGSTAVINGAPKSPKHQIVTNKLQSLGMKFGGTDLVRETVSQLVEACG